MCKIIKEVWYTHPTQTQLTELEDKYSEHWNQNVVVTNVFYIPERIDLRASVDLPCR